MSSLTYNPPTYYDYRTPYGRITIGEKNGAVYRVELGKITLEGTYRPSELSNACATQLLEFFAGKRQVFDLPLAPTGSDFKQKVWCAVENIPYGQTRTSTEIAQVIGRPNSFRMVGTAVKENPLIVLIPTHRVINPKRHSEPTDKKARLQTALLDLEKRFA